MWALIAVTVSTSLQRGLARCFSWHSGTHKGLLSQGALRAPSTAIPPRFLPHLWRHISSCLALSKLLKSGTQLAEREPPINNGGLLAGAMFVLTPRAGEGAGLGRVATLQRGRPWLQPELPVVGKSCWSLGFPAWSSSAGQPGAGPCSQLLSRSISAWLKQRTRWETFKQSAGPALCSVGLSQVRWWQVAAAASYR